MEAERLLENLENVTLLICRINSNFCNYFTRPYSELKLGFLPA